VQVKYKQDKDEIFKNKNRHFDCEMPELSYFEKSKLEMSAEETTEMLERIASIGYEHSKGLFQSKEIDFVGTQREKAQGNDKGRAPETVYETQKKTIQI